MTFEDAQSALWGAGLPAAPLLSAPDGPLQALGPAPQGGRARWLTSRDQKRLRAAYWPALTAEKGTVFLLPGRTEYIEKYADTAATLQAAGFGVLALDWRGQGLSDRLLPDPLKGHIDDMRAYQADLNALIASAQGLAGPWFMLSHSMGGAIGLRHLMSAHPFKAAAFCAPMWGVRLPVPRVMRPLVAPLARLLCALGQGARYAPMTGPVPYILGVPFEGNLLTRSRATWDLLAEQIREIPALQIAGATLGWLSASLRDCADLAARPAPDLPVLTLMGADERVVRQDAIRDRMSAWPDARFIELPDAEHELLMDLPQTRAEAERAIIDFFIAHRG